MRNLLIAVAVLAILVVGFYAFNTYIYNEKQREGASAGKSLGDEAYKNLTYMVEGKPVTLRNGYAEEAIAPGSASKKITRYFGNEVRGDLDGDGVEDIGFILTQEEGGSGVFYYAAAALKKGDSYQAIDATIIGDRIAPQANEIRDGRFIVHYADREPGQPMSTQPSVGKTLILKLDPATMQFGQVVENFEGESTEPEYYKG